MTTSGYEQGQKNNRPTVPPLQFGVPQPHQNAAFPGSSNDHFHVGTKRGIAGTEAASPRQSKRAATARGSTRILEGFLSARGSRTARPESYAGMTLILSSFRLCNLRSRLSEVAALTATLSCLLKDIACSWSTKILPC